MTEMMQVNGQAIMPVMDIEMAIERRAKLISFVKEIMVQDVDYGKIPGTSKDTLLKPGAEKLTSFFGLSPKFPIQERETDWTGEAHGGEPFFYFQYRCQLYRGDLLVGEGLGSCNSWEKKYRYRTASKICPKCNQPAIIKGKEEYGGGWLCFGKKGGCGAKWPDGADIIESQETGQILNENPQDLVNTIDKMAQKRALVAATLIAVNASEFFTQDMEDLTGWVPVKKDVVEGKVKETKNKTELQKDNDALFDMETESAAVPREAVEPQSKPETPETGPDAHLRVPNQWESEITQAAVELKVVQAAPHAVNILNKSPFYETVPYGKLDTVDGLAFICAWQALKRELPDEDSDFREKSLAGSWQDEGVRERWRGQAADLLAGGE